MKSFVTLSVSVFVLAFTQIASAHVVVKPESVNVAQFQTFSIGVPSEKESATIALRVVIPEGLKYVSPTVKPGWTIAIKKDGEGEAATVTEIVWTGGSIPSGQRDDFSFSAQVPAKEAKLAWKAYQTYENGEVAAWDQTPDEHKEHEEGFTPYSQTVVVNDLTNPVPFIERAAPLWLVILALVMGGLSLAISLMKRGS